MSKTHRPKRHDNWRTPRDFYETLDAQYDFNFDPCPYMHDVSRWDGLNISWSERNFVNPPYSHPHLRKWVIKAYHESRLGKLCVMLIPASTDTNLFHDVILPYATTIQFVRGRLRFTGLNAEGKECNDPAMKGSMIVVFDGRPGSL